MGGIYLPKPTGKGFLNALGLRGPGSFLKQAEADWHYAFSPPEEEEYKVDPLKPGQKYDSFGKVIDGPKPNGIPSMIRSRIKRQKPAARSSSLLTQPGQPQNRSSLLTGGY